MFILKRSKYKTHSELSLILYDYMIFLNSYLCFFSSFHDRKICSLLGETKKFGCQRVDGIMLNVEGNLQNDI